MERANQQVDYGQEGQARPVETSLPSPILKLNGEAEEDIVRFSFAITASPLSWSMGLGRPVSIYAVHMDNCPN